MNKRKWIILLIILPIFLIIMFIFQNGSPGSIPVKNVDLSYVSDLHPENNYFYNKNCVIDSDIAAKIGSAVIDSVCKKSIFDIGSTSVEYDSTNGLWRVSRTYLFSSGGYVIIQESNGAIIKMLLYK